MAEIGIPDTSLVWEHHWATALSDADIKFLAHEAHVTTIRLPVGYFSLGPRFCASTPFADVAEVYRGAWDAVVALCERLYAQGIGVLLDLHALPGGANDQEHSGTSSGEAGMWGDPRWESMGKECVLFMAEEVSKGVVRGCAGIQLVNEACWRAEGMYAWYEDVVKAVAGVDVSLPLYISDGWDLGRAMEWCGRVNRVDKRRNIVGVAVSKYYCFTEDHQAQSPREIFRGFFTEMRDVAAASGGVLGRGAVQVIVAEWSCVLSSQTWEKASSCDRDEMVRNFGYLQSTLWKEKAGGAFFWTAKMDWMDGGEWGFFEMADLGAVVPAENLGWSFDEVTARVEEAKRTRERCKRNAVESHIGYWEEKTPGRKYEHWRFEQGWDLGFADAMAFFGMRTCGGVKGASSGADTIGCLELWVLKRLRDVGDQGTFAWEWEHGFRQGVAEFGIISRHAM